MQSQDRKTDWWKSPRAITIFHGSKWIKPYADRLAARCTEKGDEVILISSVDEIPSGDVCFLLSCTQILSSEKLSLNRVNLVVHESDLPQGRGFAPMTWQVLEGKNDIPICLIEVEAEVDAGPIVFRDEIKLDGSELAPDLRKLQGEKTIELCSRFLDADEQPKGIAQEGSASVYRRRSSEDSEIDPEQSIADQFNLLRTVDNNEYPAYFHLRGRKYRLKIEKADES